MPGLYGRGSLAIMLFLSRAGIWFCFCRVLYLFLRVMIISYLMTYTHLPFSEPSHRGRTTRRVCHPSLVTTLMTVCNIRLR